VKVIRLACLWAGLVALFRGDWAAMGHQWWDSSTYNHILMVPAILVWLVSQRLPELLRLVALWRGGLMMGALLVWALGALAGVAQVTQIAAVAMLIAACL
jgi:hypothetical protein